MAKSSEPGLLLLYGTLRRGEPMFEQLGLSAALEFVAEATFPGTLYDLGDYPGAVAGDGLVAGELHRIRDPAILAALDEYEEFDPANPATSLFVRQRILIPEVGEAWIYLYNGSREHHPRIASGKWRKRRSAA
jgi:gamma-glutamylcyclotransferase (GGCT)/AIG2-like uncharacterized protein YtfP